MFSSCSSWCASPHASSSDKTADDNLHRDTDKREPAIECNAVSTVCEPLEGLTEDDHRSVMIHRPDRTRDVPFCEYAQLSLYTADTNRNPERTN